MPDHRGCAMSPLHGYRSAVTRLASAQKPGAGVPPYTRFVNRPMGRRLAAAAHVVGLSPDQVTAVSVLASSVGLALLTLLAPSVSLGLLIGFLMVLGYALDSADGHRRQAGYLRGATWAGSLTVFSKLTACLQSHD